MQNIIRMAQNQFARICVNADRADVDLLPLSTNAESNAPLMDPAVSGLWCFL